MYQKETVIINESGLHARPAGIFVAAAAKFASVVTIKNLATGKSGKAKSIISLLTMGLSKGTAVEIAAEGVDENTAVDSLIDLLQSGCGE